MPQLARCVSGLGPCVVRELRPGEQPASSLAQALEVPRGTALVVADRVAALLADRAADARLLVVIDQLEELFTLAGAIERAAFLAALRAFGVERRCAVVVALRADFFGALMESDLWAERRGKLSRIEVSPLRGEALRDAIMFDAAPDPRAAASRGLRAAVELIAADRGAGPIRAVLCVRLGAMCMFTVKVVRIEATRIFARKTAADRQLVIYEMKVSAPTTGAMVLPIPVVPGSGEGAGAVRFVALDHVPTFFEQLDQLFERDQVIVGGRGRSASAPTLEVHRVGAFEASYVPTLADFERLDPRFRMPRGTLDSIPGYADWGFAVFQLAPTPELAQIHPMGFEFKTRAPDQLFFPTVHCHKGEIPDYAVFDHLLYAQGVYGLADWKRQRYHDGLTDKVAALLDPKADVNRFRLTGFRANEDTWADLTRR